MSNGSWESGNGLVLRDLVPGRLRRQWADRGDCPGLGLYQSFHAQVRRRPGRIAVQDPEADLSFRELDDRVREMAGALRARGIGPGDVVGIRVPDSRHAPTADLAVAAVGAVALPWPTGHGRREGRALLAGSRAVALITDRVVDGADDSPYLRHRLTLDQLRAAGAGRLPSDFRPAVVDPESPARILVSSGSEAAPTMVAYSHNAVVGGRGAYVEAVLRVGTDPEAGTAGPARVLVMVPLASSFGSLGVVALARCGATLQLPGRFEAASALRAVTGLRPTHLVGVPTMLRRMAEHPPVPGEDLSSLRAVVSSGALLDPAVLSAALARFRRPLVNVYGSSDGVNCRTVWTAPGGDVRRVGRPDPRVTDIRICGADDKPLPPGESGEIQALGPMSPLCHVGAPAADRRHRTPDGWVRTGDRGVLGPDGELLVLDRIKHVVIRGGWTISPAEVEALLHAHPAVAEAACVAVPDPDLGERLCACLVQRPRTAALGVDLLGAYLAGEHGLERRKLPEFVLQLDSFPLGPTGKVCRKSLTATAQARFGPP